MRLGGVGITCMEPACWSWPVLDEVTREAVYVHTMPAARSLLMAWQAGLCAICGVAYGEAMFMDHDHLSWLIRGLLCPSCNTREGRRTGHRLFTLYRQRHPAAILGLSVVYLTGVRYGPTVPRPVQIEPDGPDLEIIEAARARALQLETVAARARSVRLDDTRPAKTAAPPLDRDERIRRKAERRQEEQKQRLLGLYAAQREAARRLREES